MNGMNRRMTVTSCSQMLPLYMVMSTLAVPLVWSSLHLLIGELIVIAFNVAEPIFGLCSPAQRHDSSVWFKTHLHFLRLKVTWIMRTEFCDWKRVLAMINRSQSIRLQAMSQWCEMTTSMKLKIFLKSSGFLTATVRVMIATVDRNHANRPNDWVSQCCQNYSGFWSVQYSVYWTALLSSDFVWLNYRISGFHEL